MRGRPRKHPGAVPAPDYAPAGDDVDALRAPRAEAAAEIADIAERKRALSALLRDPAATGAERVAASRELRATEQSERGEVVAAAAGPPAPATRDEQVARLVRILAAAGPDIRQRAVAICAERFTAQRKRLLGLLPALAERITLPTTSASTTTAGAPHVEASRPQSPGPVDQAR